MFHDPEPTTTSSARLTAEELANLVGDPLDRVQQLTALGVLQPDDAGLYSSGEAHRVRVIDGFEAAGVPLDVLVRAQAAEIISVEHYDQLHAAPGRPSKRGLYDRAPRSIDGRGRAITAPSSHR